MNSNRTETRMDPRRWQRLKTILVDALEETSPAKRTSLVEVRCADDPALLREAQSLLTEAEFPETALTDSFEECADNATATLWREDLFEAGRRLGAYVLVRELGRGGMGTVYLAARADGQFEKQVAIKLLKRGTDTDEVLRRFSTERHILARLDHQNIARLLDAGTTDDGLPYFVMEYVAGAPVTRVVRELNLSIAKRLELFLKICAAVAVAHKNHVIHRDLKPSNILVNAEGEPKLLDFGIAKLLGPAESAQDVTAPGQQHLTPISASPEQARGETITNSSDIYALGALLYQLLTGQTPHRFSSPHPSREEVIRVVSEEEPLLPSRAAADHKLKHKLRGDLDTIVLCAMRKDPARRYPSVAEFAEDIRRYLDGLPIKARFPTVAYRTQRFLTRNSGEVVRFAWTAAGVVLLAAALVWLLGLHPKLRPLLDSVSLSHQRAPLSDKSIAVLPFQNLSTQKENAFFADGVKDQILMYLAKVADLKVIGHTSVQHYGPDQPRNFREISDQLGVSYVLEGSVQRDESRVRVTAKLIDARNQTQLWAESYDRQLADLFAIESEIARTIVTQLQAKLLPREKTEMDERPTRDLMAYDLYLQGKEIVNGYLEVSDPGATLRQAVRLLNEATERDPNFTLAYCYAARAHNLLYRLELDPTPERAQRAENTIQAALRLQPASGEAHLALADYYLRCHRDPPRALKELEIARSSLPNSMLLCVLTGHIHRRAGRWDEAEPHYARAVELDPRNPYAVTLLADCQILRRKYSAALATYERANRAGLGSPILRVRTALIDFAATGETRNLREALADSPAHLDVAGSETPLRILMALAERDYKGAANVLAASPRSDFQDIDLTFYYPRAWYEAQIARARGDHAAAKVAFAAVRPILEARLAQAKEHPRAPRILAVLAQVNAGLGEKDLAIEEARRAYELKPLTDDTYDGSIILQGLALVYAWTGEKDLAFEALEKLVAVPGYLNYGLLRTDPAWEPLRRDERFDRIVASLAPRS